MVRPGGREAPIRAAQEVYAAAYMWGAATALAKTGTPAAALDTCASGGRDPAQIAAMVRVRR